MWVSGDVAEQVLGFDEVVAGVEVAVVLERDGVAARLAEDADAGGEAAPRCDRGVERLHEDGADVARDPFVEDGDKELTEASGSTERVGDRVAFLESCLVVALDDRDELDEPRAESSRK